MRCEVCDKFVPGGDLVEICDECKQTISECMRVAMHEPDVSYSVIPSTECGGRVERKRGME